MSGNSRFPWFPGIQASNFPSLPVAFCNFPSRSLPVKGECDLQFPFPFPGAKKPFPLTPGHCSCNSSVRLGHIHIKESYLINPIYSSFSLVAHTWTYWMVSNSMMVPPCPWVQPSSSSRESHSKPSWSQRPPWLWKYFCIGRKYQVFAHTVDPILLSNIESTQKNMWKIAPEYELHHFNVHPIKFSLDYI